MWTDAHCHLDGFEDPLALLEEASSLGVSSWIAVSETLESMQRLLSLKQKFPSLHIGFGIHPVYFSKYKGERLEEALSWMRKHIEMADVLGEVGLDHKFAKTEEEKQRQRELLERQIEMAREYRLPLNLHSRWALRQTMEVAIEYVRSSSATALLHWFTHSKKLIRITNEAGIFVSAGPTLLSSESAKEVVAHIRRDLLLLETDTPVQGARPSWIPKIGEVVAEIWKTSLEKVEEQVEENFWRYLGKN